MAKINQCNVGHDLGETKLSRISYPKLKLKIKLFNGWEFHQEINCNLFVNINICMSIIITLRFCEIALK